MRKSLTRWIMILCCLVTVPALAQKQRTTHENKDAELLRAQALLEQAVKLRLQGKYNEATPLAEQALEIRERLLSAEHQDVADTLNELGILHAVRGQHDKAEILFERVLAIKEKTLGKDHPHVADTLNNLALLHKLRGEYDRAELLYRRALAIHEILQGEDHPNLARCLDNLGSLHSERGEYDKAEALHRRALEVREKGLGKDHPDVAESLNNLGSLHHERGEYDKAKTLYQRALAIKEKQLGKDHPLVASSLNNLASLYLQQGEYNIAEALYRRALAISEKARGEDHPLVAISLTSLASLHSERGEYDRAEALYRRALAMKERALGKDHPEVARSLSNLALVHYKRSEYDRARSLYQRTIAIYEEALGKDHPDVAASVNNLAHLYWVLGEYDRAEPLVRRGLAIRERTLGKNHPEVTHSLHTLALLHSARRDSDAALRVYEQKLHVCGQNLRVELRSGSEDQKRKRWANLEETATPLSFHLHVAPENARAAALAMNTILLHKGRVLDAMADTMRAAREQLDEDGRARLDRLQRVRSELAHLFHQGPGMNDAAIARYRRRRVALEREIDELDAEIARSNPVYRALARDVRAADIQAALPHNAALLELFIYRPFTFHAPGVKNTDRYGEPRYAAYVVRRDGPVRGVDLGPVVRIDAAARAFRESVAGHRADFAERARALDALVMAPVRPLLGNAQRLYVAPDGQLSLVSFAALINEQGQYLIEHTSLTYLTSGRNLVQTLPSLAPQSAPLILADPRYDLTHAPVATRAAPSVSASDTRRSSRHACQAISRLPGTHVEAHALGAMLEEATIWTQETATESALASVHGPRILHIATHAFFLPDQDIAGDTEAMARFSADTHPRIAVENGLLRSGLYLAGASQCRGSMARPGTRDDGVLTALEASSLDLRGTRLVVLSACETGMGDIKIGQGIYGLRRAFSVAGAETLVMSLWRVSDAGTEYLMRRYYENLHRGHGRSEALRAVQLDLITHGGNRAHPFYWASFIVSGNDSTLDGKAPRLPAPSTRAGCAGCASSDAGSPGWLLGLIMVLWLLARVTPHGRRHTRRSASR